MPRVRRTVDDWRRVVFSTRRIPDSAKVLLLWMADRASTGRSGMVVSVPRDEMAAALGVSERRIDERIKAAREAELLIVVRAGFSGHTAEYGLVFPSSSARDSVALSRPESASPTSALSQRDSVALSPHERARKTVAPIGKPSEPLTACEPCGGYGCPICCGTPGGGR